MVADISQNLVDQQLVDCRCEASKVILQANQGWEWLPSPHRHLILHLDFFHHHHRNDSSFLHPLIQADVCFPFLPTNLTFSNPIPVNSSGN